MNILLATDSNLERKGVCLFLLQWVKGIRRLGVEHKVTVYFRKSILDHELETQFHALCAKIVCGELPPNASSLRLNNRKKVRTDICRLLAEERLDIVHVNSSSLGFTSIILSEAVKAKVPLRISHSHGRIRGNGLKSIYHWFLRKFNNHAANSLAGCSIDAGRYSFGIDVDKSSKWYFIPNTIDAESFAFNENKRVLQRRALNIGDNELLLGAVGYLEPVKNHFFLVEVFKELKKSKIPAKLVIIGEGSQHRILTEHIVRCDLENDVFLLGASNDVTAWLSAMDIFLMPSLSEGLPISAVEAQANGLPCIFSECVPQDVDLGADVFHLPIDKGTEAWTWLISTFKTKTMDERKAGVEYIKIAGFDSSNTPDYVKTLYQL